jgi:hypothetical protein
MITIFVFLRRLFAPAPPPTLQQRLLAMHIIKATPSRRL